MDSKKVTGFVLPAAKPGEAHTVIFGQTVKGKSLMPDHSELTTELATKAFQMIGGDNFAVSANLSVDNPDSFRNFGRLESILLMAFNQGLSQAKDAIANLAGTKWVSTEAANECLDAIDARLQLGAMEPQ